MTILQSTETKPVHDQSILGSLGPGLITGASDDDPSGVATYSQAGAKFGLGMLWITVFTIPLMVAIQEISARIGRATGRGIAANLRRYYSAWISYPIIVLLILANTINIGADIGAMGAAVKMLIGGPGHVYSVLLAVVSLVLQIWIPYESYAKVLKWLTLTLLAYIGVIFAVHVPWAKVVRATFLPPIHLDAAYLSLLVAVLGTTISPYLFFWQASLEVQELKDHHSQHALRRADDQEIHAQFRRIRIDTWVGMTFSNVVAFYIILTAAVTLHTQGITDIQTADQAAAALKPIAGGFASLLFASGIVATGLLAVPVLAGAGAYGLGELLNWPTGLERKPRHAKGFYGIIAAATLLGTGINFTRLDPIKALIYSALINGVVAVPIMVILMFMMRNPRIMGKLAGGSKSLWWFGWLATAVMAAAVIGMVATWGK
jgi:NRAMP (natural resistance-associated macrophage protein)-like metal ion transporter